jgi:hypothetical protein
VIAIALLVVIGAVVAIVLSLQTSTAVHLQQDFGHDTTTLVNQLSTLISNNQS